MNDERDIDPGRERELERGLRELEDAGPDAAFRARLRDAFVSGEIRPGRLLRDSAEAGGSGPDLRPAPVDPPAGSRTPPIPEVVPGYRGAPPPLRLWLVPVLAAAAVVLFLVLRPEQAEIRVTGMGAGSIHIEDHRYPLAESERYAHLLTPGVAFEVSGDMTATLQIDVDDDYTLHAVAGVEMTMPRPPAKGRPSFEIESGEVRISTLTGLAGGVLEILSPASEVHVMGTTLAVLSSPDSTCVCVLEGTAMMMSKGAEMMVEPGMRRTVFMDASTDDMLEEIRADERMKLAMLRDQVEAR